MRKIMLGLLLAGAASPVLAAGGPRWHNDDNNSPRQETRAERPARSNSSEARPSVDRSARQERSVDVQRPQFDRSQFGGNFQRPERATQVERPQFNGYERGDRAERPVDVQRVRPVTRYNPYVAQERNSDAPDSVRNWRPRQQGGYVGGTGRTGYNRDGYVGRQAGSYVPRQGTQPPLRVDNHRRDQSRWNTNWRNDRRYDWRDRRRYNSSLFHIGLYIDPFGWGYQPYSVGYRLWPNYYQQNYWIDPAMYGLPFPPPGLQWVRYWNDAVLVDTFSGQVVDSIPGFFW